MNDSKNGTKKQFDIPLGCEFDIVIDCNEEFNISVNKISALDLNASERKSFALATSRSKSARASSRPKSAKSTRINKLNLTDNILEGANMPTVRRVGVVSSRMSSTAQPPMSISQFDSKLSQTTREHPTTARSTRKDFPNGYVQTYVFGFENPQPYIPHPFVSSHRPKTPRPVTASARMRNTDEFGIKLKKKVKLSSKREVPISKESSLTNSLTVRSLEEFLNENE
ncbi:hypothetical protein TVAG_079380 [Trichomonas vaginalis G3]|uniref:Uncharacterized protein n=1 Tax=Trichomonas vaginalis (strain ATCC PRA-98 / G3) TaxID=412133 RepID=A2EF70_TRIV3|nr:hypothetical protein TVAGG3_1030220 [Trichomonas vaginalis G3]EAY08680.1 hypothetical protein TVAG_079380 [Trichomonas vaginalis G3]KAI5492807.1 hypothetical protein TVAGG3_1030220 [Trichomonas vaginalis G3]|eukprot:XP_001320903.1 hypothetical protein [Trichomonas vaginalis G3]